VSEFESFSSGAEARRSQPGRAWRPDEQHQQEALIRYLGAVAAQAHARAGEQGAAPHAGIPTAPMHAVVAPDEGAAAVARVRDVMTAATASVTEELPFRDLARVLSQGSLGAVPVTDADGRVIGVVSESDLLAKAAVAATPHGPWVRLREHRLYEKGKAETAVELMTAPAVTVHAGTPVAEAAWTAARARLKRMPVVDHNNRLVGMVTRGDLLAALVRDDESIRADVEERILRRELQMAPEAVHVQVDNGVVTLDGRVEDGVRQRLVEEIGSMGDVSAVVDHLAAA
jgi:CBS-domain-containing membrane protein